MAHMMNDDHLSIISRCSELLIDADAPQNQEGILNFS